MRGHFIRRPKQGMLDAQNHSTCSRRSIPTRQTCVVHTVRKKFIVWTEKGVVMRQTSKEVL